ncbi:MAG: class I SAM-dependent methyltransferase [Opitutaceae bacterium]
METTSLANSTISAPLPLVDAPQPRMAERLFIRALGKLQGGGLRIYFPSGACVLLGDAEETPIEMLIENTQFFRKIFSGGSVGLGEAYVDGLWKTSNLSGLLTLLAKNQKELGRVRYGFSVLAKKMNKLYHKARRNTLEQSKENIQEHYDLSNAFYETFLDPTMTYSSARFLKKEETLEQAQWNKIDRILDLAGLKAGDSVLEIGSGWGALAQRAAERGCLVKTITLSEEQFAYAKDLFEKAGISDKVDIALQDYRTLIGQFDAVVSCEMIEAVGHEFLESYFATIQQSLKPGAKAVIQAITIPDERYERYCDSCDWIQKYIFPGGHLPSPGAIRSNVAHAGDMKVLTMEPFGQDYAETLRRWAVDFNANHKTVNALGFDEKFCRKWNYYFSYCEAGFNADLIDVQHVVLQRNQVG